MEAEGREREKAEKRGGLWGAEQERSWDFSKVRGSEETGLCSDMWSLGCLVDIHTKLFRKVSGQGFRRKG